MLLGFGRCLCSSKHKCQPFSQEMWLWFISVYGRWDFRAYRPFLCHLQTDSFISKNYREWYNGIMRHNLRCFWCFVCFFVFVCLFACCLSVFIVKSCHSCAETASIMPCFQMLSILTVDLTLLPGDHILLSIKQA